MGVPRIGRRPPVPKPRAGTVVLTPEQSMFSTSTALAWESIMLDQLIFAFIAPAEVDISAQARSRGVLLYIPAASYDNTKAWLVSTLGTRPVQGPIDPRTPAPQAGRVVEDDD